MNALKQTIENCFNIWSSENNATKWTILFCNRIMSNGIGQQSQPQRLGVYTATNDTQHGRKVYKQDFGGSNYLYYWDWGPNNGANWIVGFNPSKKVDSNVKNSLMITIVGYLERRARGIESANLENATITNICAEKVQTVGPFRVNQRQKMEIKPFRTKSILYFIRHGTDKKVLGKRTRLFGWNALMLRRIAVTVSTWRPWEVLQAITFPMPWGYMLSGQPKMADPFTNIWKMNFIFTIMIGEICR